MSTSYNRRKKELKKARSPEEKKLDAQIKNGKLPRAALQLGEKGLPKVRGKYGQAKIAWKQLGTKSLLLDRTEQGES